MFAKPVTIETRKQDRYGRHVGKVLVDGVDVSLSQIKRGFAWHYKAHESEQSADDHKLYGAEEDTAKAAKRGLWYDPEPTPPWSWRKQRQGFREAGPH